jgi:hypothetical protein
MRSLFKWSRQTTVIMWMHMCVCMFLTVAVVDPWAPILRLFCAACVPASVVVVEWRARWCTRKAVSGASHATEVGVSQCMLREAYS